MGSCYLPELKTSWQVYWMTRMVRMICLGLILTIHFIDMMHMKTIILNDQLEPESFSSPQLTSSEFIEAVMGRYERRGSGRKPVGNKTYALGTNLPISHTNDPRGFLSTVFTAYAHHLHLITSPEDWWLTIVQKVVAAVDQNSEKEIVRKHFVGHEGKKELVVHIDSINDVGEEDFFNQMSQQMTENIKDPGYVANLQQDFSTSTSLHGIVGNVAIMSSLQEYFVFTGRIECGIPSIEMKGTLQDWERLGNKFQWLRNRLSTISEEIGLTEHWWNGTEVVLTRLLKTYKGEPDRDWWNQIIEKRDQFAGCGTVTEWDGWFLQDFLGQKMDHVQSSLLSVPLTIDDNGLETQAALVAGITGFILDKNETTIEAQH